MLHYQLFTFGGLFVKMPRRVTGVGALQWYVAGWISRRCRPSRRIP